MIDVLYRGDLKPPRYIIRVDARAKDVWWETAFALPADDNGVAMCNAVYDLLTMAVKATREGMYGEEQCTTTDLS